MTENFVRPIKALKMGIYYIRSYKSYRSYINLISYTREYTGSAREALIIYRYIVEFFVRL